MKINEAYYPWIGQMVFENPLNLGQNKTKKIVWMVFENSFNHGQTNTKNESCDASFCFGSEVKL